MTNLYADAIFAENPTALWALDDNLAVASLSSLPSNIALTAYGTPAVAYGSEKNQGYYIGTSTTTSTLKVRASGIPMVYGATNITNLDENTYTINTNLSINPSFEANLTGWTMGSLSAIMGITSEQSYSGTHSMKIMPDSSSWYIRTPTGTSGVPVTAGSIYSLSAYVRSTIRSQSFRVSIHWYNSSGTSLTTSIGSTIASSTTSWTRLSVSETAPVGAVYASLRVNRLDTGAIVTELSHYIDAVLFEKSSTPSGYFDGSSVDTKNIDYLWSGTINYSSSIAKAISYPSLIFPGFGFLNEDGKNKRLTIEAWIRISPSTQITRKIIGPIIGDNGLYVNGGFLSLKIGENIGSHYVGEWGRPMLVHIYYTGTSAGVLLNGESVISINYDYKTIEFPTKLNSSSEDQDWIGFYSYSDITNFQLDCVSIYPYQMPVEKAKLHFVKGQAVESPETKNSSYFDVPVVIDYQMSKYANNYTYPGAGRWRNGIIDNLSTDNNVLSAPNYQLPQLILEDNYRTVSDWNSLQADLPGQPNPYAILSDGELIDNDAFFKIVPDNISNTTFNYAGYLYFDKLNILQDPVKAVYGVFSVASLPSSEELLFRVSNSSNEYFEAVINGNDITHRFVSPATTTVEIVSSDVVTANAKFAVGIDIDVLLAEKENNQLSKFFSNASDLKVFLGGPPSFNGGTTIDTSVPKLFGGNIYKFGFLNQNNLNKIKAIFTDGIADADEAETFDMHIGSYTLFGNTSFFGTFTLDIAVNGTWKDYISLSQLDKNIITDATGNTTYSLDFVQMNLDATEMSNVTNSPVRSYVEFSEIATSIVSANQIVKTDQAISSTGVILFEPEAEWLNKRYEFKNGNIVYLPVGGYGSYEDLGLVTHLDFFIPGIIRNPLKIKMLQIASQALNYSGIKTPIGTRFGKDIYSFGTTSGSRDYSKKNAYSMYKGTTPYLYLTRQSGIKLLGSTFDGTRGIEIPINASGKDYYKVSVLYASVLYDKPFSEDIELFRIKHNTDTIIVYADYQSPTTTSAELKAKKLSDNSIISTGPNPVVQFFVNGIEDETITYGEWNMIGILFNGLLDFSFRDGIDTRIDITGPFLVNNISDYQIDEAAENNSVTFLYWSDVQGTLPTYETWQDVITEGNWRNQFISDVSVINIKLDASAIYSAYLGSNRVIANEDGYLLELDQNEYNTYLGIRSSLIKVSPL